jgi:chromosome segregation ATPase
MIQLHTTNTLHQENAVAITRENIWSAADLLDQAGEKPTLAAIRKRVGGGSYTTISDAMSEWHARRAAQKAPQRDPVPEKVNDAAAEFSALVWQVAEEIANGRLQAERTAIEEARQQLEAEKVEAAAFADQLNQELEAAKGKGAELAAALEAAGAQVAALQGESTQERARADRAEAVSDERQKSIDTLKEQLMQVRADKDSEIARLVAVRTKPGA